MAQHHSGFLYTTKSIYPQKMSNQTVRHQFSVAKHPLRAEAKAKSMILQYPIQISPDDKTFIRDKEVKIWG